MRPLKVNYIIKTLLVLTVFAAIVGMGCSTTKHLKDKEYLLRKNTIAIESNLSIAKKTELRDNLQSLLPQHPNTYSVFGLFPIKVWLYNLRYKKYQRDSNNFQIKAKTAEKPVIYDSSLVPKAIQFMQSYLYNQGFFYAQIKDTVTFRNKKAYPTYKITTGIRYLIQDIKLNIDDSTMSQIVKEDIGNTVFRKNEAYTMSMLDDERSRIISMLRNNGYYKIGQDNITYQLDTAEKRISPDSINNSERHDVTVHIIIHADDEPNAFRKYCVNKISIFPDYTDKTNVNDTSNLINKMVSGISFHYHNYYVRENVILQHIFLSTKKLYSQEEYDQTLTKLNELGIFQYARIYFTEDTTTEDKLLNCTILLKTTKKYDLTFSSEASNASTYDFGSAVTISFLNRNIGKGADLLSTSVTGGIQDKYSENIGNGFFNHFSQLSRNFGANATLTFPKFLLPFSDNKVSPKNTPRTILDLGFNLVDRLDYFTLINYTSKFTYNWHETKTKVWDISPAFINIFRLPRITDGFQKRLDTNEFLRNTYKENFIEGENITFTYNNSNVKNGKNYSVIKTSLEEVGGLLSGLAGISDVFKNSVSANFAQYVKLDLDARHYITRRHSVTAFRFYGGIGLPYDRSVTLPYIKQYFAGGAYSIRGWNVRSLGPGGYYNPKDQTSSNPIDHTGDIKIEMNGEYRFDMFQLFSGNIKVNGALFTDAGNIWLARKSTDYPNGEFALNTFGSELAVSSGAGIRFDIAGYIVFRIDGAFPVKKPYIMKNAGWVLNEIAPFDKTWRANNLVLQIALGYPF